MLEEGVVTGQEGEYALVEKRKDAACGSCTRRGACETSEPGDKVVIKAHNIAGASEGDHVQISFDSSLVIRSAFIVYIVPVLMLIAGSGFGSLISDTFQPSYKGNVYQVLFGLLSFLLSFFIVRRYNKRFEADRESKPQIVKII